MSDPAIAGVVYERGQAIRDVMKDFVAELKASGVNVHGILQETPKDLSPDAIGCGVDAIDIKTGTHVALVRPTQYELDNKICSLDLGQLAEASMSLRRALIEHADIVVVEKFGKHEKDGGGLSDELLAVMAEGIPTVVSVPKSEQASWETFSGGMGDTLACELDQLQHWWAAHKP